MRRLFNRQQRLALYKLFALLSLVRWYNILVVLTAQYLASIFILNPDKYWLHVLMDLELHLTVFSTGFIIASGFIINAFYDAERDIINKPKEAMLYRLVSQQTSLNFYFLFNTIGMVMSFYVSKRVMLFNFLFSIGLWFYSHKLKKMGFFGNLSGVLLTIAPFLVIILYYDNINYAIFFYVSFIALVELIREIIKDVVAEKGDVIYGYRSVPVDFGLEKTKRLLYTLLVLTPLPPVLLYYTYDINNVIYYFILSGLLFMYAIFLIYRADKKEAFIKINNLFKLIIGLGILSIALV